MGTAAQATGVELRLAGIEKSFGSVRALRGVDLAVRPGRVHALLGANGSGKSTLVKVLTGVHRPDAGRLLLDGAERRFETPQAAATAGVRAVQQDAPLVERLSVQENLALFRGYPRRRGGWIAWDRLHASTEALLERFGIRIDPAALVGGLDVAQRAMVAIAIALDGADLQRSLLVLDEATATMDEANAHALLDVVAGLARQGLAVLAVTHRVREVLAYAQDVTLLVAGEVRLAGEVGDASERGLFELLGAPRDQARSRGERTGARTEARAPAAPGALPLLRLDGVSGGRLRDVSFALRAGEILGLAGLPHGGVRDLPRLLVGDGLRARGRIELDGADVADGLTPHRALEAGIALVPADRRRDGGAMTLSVAENMLLPRLPHAAPGRARRERATVAAAIERLDVRPPDGRALLGHLSGGNQQKTVIAKWLLTEPRVVVFDDPTAGVDPRAREAVFDAMRDAAARGAGVLLLTSEPGQFEALCDRVLLIEDGRVADELAGDDVLHERIARWLAE